MSLTYESLELRAELAEQRLAETKRDLRITEQARVDAEIAGRNAQVVAVPAHEVARTWRAAYLVEGVAAEINRRWCGLGAALDAVLAAHDATTPSPNRTHVVVAVDELERLRAYERTLIEVRDQLPPDDDLSDYGLGRKNVVELTVGGAS